ncbi:MAG TPA: Mrp/NBP35 family ATP-binding protein [Candidatus Krumholzibacteria bacterium]|nr:Mrp/NBP35 family ATP-binding protein [Candidatus Krumholzibacteria bacterium]
MSSPLTPEVVAEALKDVKVPGTKVDVLKINLIGEIKVSGGAVAVTVVRTSEKEETIAAVREGVAERVARIPGVMSVDVSIDDRSAPRKAPRGPHGQSPDPFADRKRLPGVRRVVAVASAKGGVGKSSVAVNLALALRDRGHQVGILDADVYGPSLPTMLGVSQGPEITQDKKIHPVKHRGLQVISMGLLMAPDQPVIWRGPLVFSAIRQFLKDVQWDGLDYLVVDMPPGTGDAQLTLVQQVPLSGVVMVTTPQEVALADVRRGIRMFREVDVPVLGVVENMSFFVCPETGKSYDIFGQGGGGRVAQEYGLPLLAQIPIDPAIREGGDSGRPAVEHEGSRVREAFLALADRVDELAVTPA